MSLEHKAQRVSEISIRALVVVLPCEAILYMLMFETWTTFLAAFGVAIWMLGITVIPTYYYRPPVQLRQGPIRAYVYYFLYWMKIVFPMVGYITTLVVVPALAIGFKLTRSQFF